jgi:hypothetical protein
MRVKMLIFYHTFEIRKDSQAGPSSKLPVTIPNYDNEVGFTTAQYPGVEFPPEAAYFGESTYYRLQMVRDANNVKPNVRSVTGSEVVQIYVG